MTQNNVSIPNALVQNPKKEEASRITKLLDILSDSGVETVYKENNEDFCSYFKLIDDRLNGLHKVVPRESRDALYEIEKAINEILAISNDRTYKQGFQDGINLLNQGNSCRKPRYLAMEFESRRKDAHRRYKDSKTGFIYKILRIVKEYTDEAQVDRDMAKLKAGEISENEIMQRRRKI